MDQMAHLLHYPQKPLGITRSMTYLHFRELPSGFNAIVGIMIYSGYNQEDSLIQNMSAHDYGLFRSSYFKVFQEKEAKKTGAGWDNKGVRFERPNHDECDSKELGDYAKLDEDGGGPRHAREREGHHHRHHLANDMVGPNGRCATAARTRAILEKVVEWLEVVQFIIIIIFFFWEEGMMTDFFCPLSPNSTCFNFLFYSSSSSFLLHLYLSPRRRTARGSRDADGRRGREQVRESAHPQRALPADRRQIRVAPRPERHHRYDLPERRHAFTMEGIVPDIIVNPHAIPSRMTVGHLIETSCRK